MGAAALLALATIADARVFWRWSAAADSVRALESCGGRIAYSADVAVNGGRGHLTVLGFDKPLERVLSALRATFRDAEFTGRDGTMATARIASGRRVIRLLALELAAGRAVVFDLDQSEAEAEASARPPADAALKDLPAYPGGETVFFVQDDHASLGAVVFRSPAGAETVQRYYAATLPGGGWTPLPLTRGLAEASLRLYVKNDRLCCVLVEPSRTEGVNRITVLHKERGIEY